MLQPFAFEWHGVVDARLHKGTIDRNYEVNYLKYEDYMVGYVKA